MTQPRNLYKLFVLCLLSHVIQLACAGLPARANCQNPHLLQKYRVSMLLDRNGKLSKDFEHIQRAALQGMKTTSQHSVDWKVCFALGGSAASCCKQSAIAAD